MDDVQENEQFDPAIPAAVQTLADELVPLFYEELKRLAQRERGKVRAGATLQTTVLVNEAYLRLRSAKGWHDDVHFLRAAALAMRHALINHAEARRAAKRGAGAEHLSLTAAENISVQDDHQVLAINEALQRLSRESGRLAQVIECRFFAGHDEATTARALNLSERTVRRDWALARAWLHRELKRGDGDHHA